jgi:predicted MPP superfamily phosphohydrolase
VDTVNAQRADVVVLLGDYVIQGVLGGRFVPPEEIAAEFSRLSAPQGVYAVLGNHDWWFDGERVRGALQGAGVHVLENDRVAVEHGGRRVWIAGLADLWTRKVDVARALRDVPAGEPVLLAMHHPDLFPALPGSVTLTLAGHTHGGQVRLPFFGPPVVPSRFGQRYASGLVVEDGRTMFVTSGVGTSIIPVRMGVPPEIVILTLR